MALDMFIPMTKVDEEKRLVYGMATQEVVDRSDEIMDYETSKPNFEKWSTNIEKATNGKSLGNVREMHSNKAAGKLTQLNFNDSMKAIEVCAKVVDEDSWQKVKEGVLTGFSIGGSYEKRWKDSTGSTRFTASPAEISLVDLPCCPTATFEVIKANGLTEQRQFQTKEKQPMEEINKTVLADFKDALAKRDTAKAFSYEEIRNRLMGALKGQVTTPFNCGYFYIKATFPDSVIICGDIDGDGDDDMYRITYNMSEDGIIALGKIEQVRMEFVPSTDEDDEGIMNGLPTKKAKKEAEADELQKRDFTAEERKKLAEKGEAMPDGSYPIANKEDLKNAVLSWGRGGAKADVKAFIIKRAKALGAENELPEDWVKKAVETDDMEKKVKVEDKEGNGYTLDTDPKKEKEDEIEEESDKEKAEKECGDKTEKECDKECEEKVDKAVIDEMSDTVKEMTIDGAISFILDKAVELDKADDAHMDKLRKLHHELTQMGAICKCDKCVKACGEDTVKAVDDTDLHKDCDCEENDLAKALKGMDDLKKAFDGLKSDNEALRKEVKDLKSQPLPGGAIVASNTIAMAKTIGGMAEEQPQGLSEVDVLHKLCNEAVDPMEKQLFSQKIAKLEMKKVYDQQGVK